MGGTSLLRPGEYRGPFAPRRGGGPISRYQSCEGLRLMPPCNLHPALSPCLLPSDSPSPTEWPTSNAPWTR
eukprot:88406-Pyramimonas_sp.AAC.1